MNTMKADRNLPVGIFPSNEPYGEGNGWDDCAEHEATQWQVFTEGPFGELVGSFDSREKAEAFVAEWKGQ